MAIEENERNVVMAKLLYVTSNLKPTEESRSLSVGMAFLNEYIKRNPEDEIHLLDVYRDNIQRIDADVLSGWEKMRRGAVYASLTADEQRKIGRIWKSADQFIAADKYVFVTPMWNLGFPAELKMYIDSICVEGKTIIYTPNGVVGLLKDMGKKCLHIHSSGSFHYGNEEDHSVPYLRAVMGLMGIADFEAIVLEGVDVVPQRAQEFQHHAIQRALEVAKRF